METVEQRDIENCKRCQAVLTGPYCSNCGLPKEVRRINRKYILSEIGSVLNFHKGILFTVRELLLRPGSNVRQFLLEDRNRLVKPILFLIICSLIYTIAQNSLKFEDGYVNYSIEHESTVNYLLKWVSTNYGYANILMAAFIGIWIKIFFRKAGYNYFEILILLCFMMGMGMLLFALFGLIDSLININLLDKGFLLGILYISWGIGQFFQKGKIVNYVKAFFSYMLGMISFTIIVMLIGVLIDLVIK